MYLSLGHGLGRTGVPSVILAQIMVHARQTVYAQRVNGAKNFD